MRSTGHYTSLVGLPEEVLEKILHCTVYDGSEFDTGMEYGNVAERCSPFSIRQSWFAEGVLMANRTLRRIGTEVLWRFVVIRSMASLQAISRQTQEGGAFFPPHSIGRATRRLQVRIAGEYDVHLLRQVLLCMPELKIFVMCNRALHGQPPRIAVQRGGRGSRRYLICPRSFHQSVE